jgi:N-methylhydantoinase B
MAEGEGFELDFRLVRPNSIVTARGMERCRFEPWGLGGGRAADRSYAFLNPGTECEEDLGRIGILLSSPATSSAFARRAAAATAIHSCATRRL